MVNYKTNPPTVETLPIDLPESSDFHPLGLALYHQTTHSTLFVANAGRNQSSIELFRVSHTTPPKLTWRRTLTDPLIRNANAILPVSPTQIYVTNDHRSRRADSKYVHLAETYSQLPFSFTTFIDFSTETVKAKTAVSLQRVANGITATPDLELVFIAESARGGFGIYKCTPDNKLDFQEYISVNGLPDNLHFDDDGYVNKDNWGKSSVVVGAHPNVLKLEKIKASADNTAPSWIVS